MIMDNANAASAVSPSPMNSGSLLTRVISSLVLLPVIIGAVWWNYWLMAGVVAIAAIICLGELYTTFVHGGYRPQKWVGVASALAVLASVALRPIENGVDVLPPTLTAIIVVGLVATLPHAHKEQTLANWALTLAGALYIGWLFSYLISLRGIETPLRPYLLAALGLPSGVAWVFGVMAVTWLQDTFAYFVGRRFGRTKLAPNLSPKKTWEGAAGGLLGAVVGAIASIYVFCLPIEIWQAVVLGLVGGVAGPLGDLAESMVKRQVGLKDAGNLIPGHGGLLDRSDSLLFTAPVLYYTILLIIR